MNNEGRSVFDLATYGAEHDGGKTVKQDASVWNGENQTPEEIDKMENHYVKLEPDYIKTTKPVEMVESLVKQYLKLIKEAVEKTKTTTKFKTDNKPFDGKESVKKYSKAPNVKSTKMK